MADPQYLVVDLAESQARGRVAFAPLPASSGGGGSTVRELVQNASDTTWTLAHGLGRRPAAATFYDSVGNLIFPDYTADETNIYAGFRNATAGRVAVI